MWFVGVKLFRRFVKFVPFALCRAPYVKGGGAAAEADGSAESVGFGMRLGRSGEEEVQEDEEEDEDGRHAGFLQVGR